MAAKPAANASMPMTILTVMANLVGAGLLSLPYSLKRAGLVAGVIAMCAMCVANGCCMVLIAKCCDMAQLYTYKEVAAAAMGRTASTLVVLAVAAYTLGSCVSFLVLLGDFVPSLVCEDGCGADGSLQAVAARREVILPLAALLILFPLSLLRNLNSLKFTSTLSTLCIVYSACMIGLRSWLGTPPRAPVSDITFLAGGTGIFVSFPIMLVSFSLHYNVAKYYEEMHARDMARITLVTVVSFSSVLILYLLTALGGYLLFGSDTASDILLNFDDGDVAAIIARVALSAIVIGCYPLAFNSLRASVTSLLPDAIAARVREPVPQPALDYKKGEDNGGGDAGYVHEEGTSFAGYSPVAPDEAELPPSPRQQLSLLQRTSAMLRRDWPHALLTFVLVSISLGVALGVPNIATVLSYKGALGGSLIVFIFPGMMYFMLSLKVGLQTGEEVTWDRVRGALFTTRAGYIALATSCIGFTMMILGTLSTAGLIKTSS